MLATPYFRDTLFDPLTPGVKHMLKTNQLVGQLHSGKEQRLQKRGRWD
jgi:hypothetical protein